MKWLPLKSVNIANTDTAVSKDLTRSRILRRAAGGVALILAIIFAEKAFFTIQHRLRDNKQLPVANLVTIEFPEKPHNSNYPLPTAVFSPDGERLLTTNRETDAQIWDSRTGRLVANLMDVVRSAVFSPDGSRVLTVPGSNSHAARVWDGRTGQPIGEPMRGETFDNFNPAGPLLVTVEKIANPPLRTELMEYSIDKMSVVAFSPDGSLMLTVSSTPQSKIQESILRLWDARNGRLLGRLTFPNSTSVFGFEFSPDGTRVLALAEYSANIFDLPPNSN